MGKRWKVYYDRNRERMVERAMERTRALRATPEGKEKDREYSRTAKRRQLSDPAEREKHNERQRDWRRSNPDYRQRFKHEQPEQKAYRAMARYARKLHATPHWVDQDAIRAVYLEAYRLTQETGVKHEVDHIVPLMGETCTGLHVPWNLRVITADENRRKGNKILPELIAATLI